MKVELIKPKSNSLEDLQNYLAECSSVVRDKDPKSPSKLWDRLLVESEGKKASRVFEYIPCKVSVRQILDAYSIGQLFGFFKKLQVGAIPYEEEYYITNMRELLNWGWSVDECLEVVNFDNYHTFKCETPYFIYGQVSTHNQVTTVSHSQRYSECDRGYWMPPEAEKHLIENLFSGNPQEEWDALVQMKSPMDLKGLMKRYGIVRKEVWDRGADMLQNRVFTLGGYTSNDNALPHFFRQRLDSHTQKETREFVESMEDLLRFKS